MKIVIKSFAGIDFNLLDKTISLKGNAFINDIKDEDYKDLLKIPSFKRMLDEGWIIAGENIIDNDNYKADTIANIKKEQRINNHIKKAN